MKLKLNRNFSLIELTKLTLNKKYREKYFDELVKKFGDEINPSSLAKSDVMNPLSFIAHFVWLYPAEDDGLWGYTIVNSRLKKSDETNPVKFVFSNDVKHKSGINTALFRGVWSRLELDESLLAIIIPGEDIYKQVLGQIYDHDLRKFLKDKAICIDHTTPIDYTQKTKELLTQLQDIG